MRYIRSSLTIVTLAAAAVHAQSDITPSHKNAWGENIGWTNWRDAGDPDASQGARVHTRFLSGFVWTENTGWITLGDGSPSGGTSYGNTDASDYGVNLNPATGELSGLAWGENVGWINFSGGLLALPPNPARLDLTARRFHGYAWGENVGWINLDHTQHFVSTFCRADFNKDGSVNTLDVLSFLNAWAAKLPSADFNADGSVNTLDVLSFLNPWASGC